MTAILRFDCAAAATSGVLVLLLRNAVSGLEGLPITVPTCMGITSIGYAIQGWTLVRASRRRAWRIKLLIASNVLWAAICVVIAAYFVHRATVTGLLLLVGEAVFVGGLAFVEARRLAASDREPDASVQRV